MQISAGVKGFLWRFRHRGKRSTSGPNWSAWAVCFIRWWPAAVSLAQECRPFRSLSRIWAYSAGIKPEMASSKRRLNRANANPESNYGKQRKSLYWRSLILNRSMIPENRRISSRKGHCWCQQGPFKTNQAERGGFEPPVRFKPHTAFPVRLSFKSHINQVETSRFSAVLWHECRSNRNGNRK